MKARLARLEQKVDDDRELNLEKFKNLEKATLLADEGIKERQRDANGMHALLKTQESETKNDLKDYMKIAEHNTYKETNDKEIKEIQLWKKGVETELKGKVDQKAVRNFYIGIGIALLIALFNLVNNCKSIPHLFN